MFTLTTGAVDVAAAVVVTDVVVDADVLMPFLMIVFSFLFSLSPLPLV